MTVNEIIKLLDKEENKYGGATGKERELKISVNGEFLGGIESAKLDGWGDGLITDVTLELQFKEEIRAKAIDEFAKEIRDWQIDIQDNEYDADKYDFIFERIFEIAEQLKAGEVNGNK